MNASTIEHTIPWGIGLPNALVDCGDGVASAVGQQCDRCGSHAFPPTARCAECGSDRLAPFVLPSSGTLYAYSIVHVAADERRQRPFVVGYVDLISPVRVFVHIDITTAQELFPGQLMELSVEQVDGLTGASHALRARPALTTDARSPSANSEE